MGIRGEPRTKMCLGRGTEWELPKAMVCSGEQSYLKSFALDQTSKGSLPSTAWNPRGLSNSSSLGGTSRVFPFEHLGELWKVMCGTVNSSSPHSRAPSSLQLVSCLQELS